MDFFLSFIMISVAGTLLSVLFPSGGAKKPLPFFYFHFSEFK